MGANDGAPGATGTFAGAWASRVRQLHAAMPVLVASKVSLVASSESWDLAKLRLALEEERTIEAEWGPFCAPEVSRFQERAVTFTGYIYLRQSDKGFDFYVA